MFLPFRTFLCVLTILLGGLLLPGAYAPTQAQDLDALRASGAVGETAEGYLVARDPSFQAFVDQVNAKRRRIYAERAKAQGVPVDQVGRVYAKEIFDDAPPGTWFRGPDGKWVQKK
ncbi:MAG: DUF1318 domain-containing protein [Alphaproteobacteria bacterium]|nr:MAG: DUF1318 domain-containing protein [Alphaproteobacteria bacterium]